MQFRKGGPIIAVQVEHEYGSYAADRKYMAFLKEVWESALVVWLPVRQLGPYYLYINLYN